MNNKKRVENSVHLDFIMDCIAKDMNGTEISRQLKERGAYISAPTINRFIKKVRAQGINVTKLKNSVESTALQINDKLKEMPELSSVFNRRNFLVETLLDRRKKIMSYCDENKRLKKIIELIDKLNIEIGDNKKAREISNELYNYISKNFNFDTVNPSAENLIRQYTMDIHELCKYVESFVGKYEIDKLLEILSKEITKAAVDSFGYLLKNEKEEAREKIINNFINKVELAMTDLRTYKLNIGENKNKE